MHFKKYILLLYISESAYVAYVTSVNQVLEAYYSNGYVDFISGHFSVQGLTRYLMSYDNTIINPDRLSLHQDMTQSVAHYFINSSHNTYLTGMHVYMKQR